MKRTGLLLLLGLVGCGGNYSNEDIDFQQALPEREDIAVKLPGQALEVADAAEYYKLTRGVVFTMGAISGSFLSLIDVVRANPPSERAPGHRVWGPYPMDDHPGWQFRLLIDRQDGAYAAFAYSIEVRRSGAWIVLVSGAFDQTGGVRRGQGQLIFDSTAARDAGYDLLTLGNLRELTIDYQTLTFPLTLKMTLIDQATGAKTIYSHGEARDGTGTMLFDTPTQFPVVAPLIRIRSRWLGSGAGRADMVVLEGTLAGKRGVDCWGIDTRATYSLRELSVPPIEMGAVGSCVFGTPAP